MTGTILMTHLPEWGDDIWRANVSIDDVEVAVYAGYPREIALEKARAFLRALGPCVLLSASSLDPSQAN